VANLKAYVVYDSKTGNTQRMAERVAQTLEGEGLEVLLHRVEEASVDLLPSVHALVLGSPVYYGLPSAGIKKFIDDSVKYHGKLTHLVGAAFCSSGGTHTGSESTLLALIEAMLVHGMVVQGESGGAHYGATSVGAPDEKALAQCDRLAERVASLVKKLNR